MQKQTDDKNIDFLMKAVLELKTEEECYNFFTDLCTVVELKTISQRLVVAKMLSENRVYREIMDETKASTATISRVNRSLSYGMNGYTAVFERLKEKNEL